MGVKGRIVAIDQGDVMSIRSRVAKLEHRAQASPHRRDHTDAVLWTRRFAGSSPQRAQLWDRVIVWGSEPGCKWMITHAGLAAVFTAPDHLALTVAMLRAAAEYVRQSGDYFPLPGFILPTDDLNNPCSPEVTEWYADSIDRNGWWETIDGPLLRALDGEQSVRAPATGGTGVPAAPTSTT